MKKFLSLLIAAVLLCAPGEFMVSAATQSGVGDIIVAGKDGIKFTGER